MILHLKTILHILDKTVISKMYEQSLEWRLDQLGKAMLTLELYSKPNEL